jgi:hypothetical protein
LDAFIVLQIIDRVATLFFFKMNLILPFLTKLNWLLSSQLGFDARHFLRSLTSIPHFLRDWNTFRKHNSPSCRLALMPCLHDWYEEGGATESEYFWQDLLVARMIFEAKPAIHVDVGSRVDGFVTNIASFREIEVLDVRPITARVPGVVFRQADLMRPVTLGSAMGYCDSLSCLHAIEHFGLGRYGDTIDPEGYRHGITNMALLLKPGGRFYLSTPIGEERVEFNANRVFDPRTIIQCAEINGLRLETLTVIGRGGKVAQAPLTEESLIELAQARYNLGIFVFTKYDF